MTVELFIGECGSQDLLKFPGGCRHDPCAAVPQISSAWEVEDLKLCSWIYPFHTAAAHHWCLLTQCRSATEPCARGVRKSPSAPLQREERNLLGEAGNDSCGFITGERQLMAKCPRKRQTCLSASPQFPPTSAPPPQTASQCWGVNHQ